MYVSALLNLNMADQRGEDGSPLDLVTLWEKEKNMGEFTTVGPASAVAEGDLNAFDVGGVKIAVANVGGTMYAFDNVCTHRQCALAEGELEETTVTCPCHGSQFDVTTGAVLRGPAQDPVESYGARVEDDAVQIEV
jgi:3-phenylpropionate/trans-cinnamate dioxygenase ferredoxin subunit